MGNEIFIDTNGVYALLVGLDDQHAAATRLFRAAVKRSQKFVTTNSILDETATLLKARGWGHLLAAFFDMILRSTVCRIAWTDSDRFREAVVYALKHADQNWSFTDCVSFCVMNDLKLRKALTKAEHFEHAGYHPLLR